MKNLFLLLFILFFSCHSEKSATTQPPNVLFIAIDDLRPELHCYGAAHMHTPHLDQLATEGRLFNNHFVQVPTCGASRFALLMGQYPQNVQFTSNQVFRDHLAKAKEKGMQTPPQVFKANGYYTLSLGKISHYVDGKVYSYDGQGDGRLEMPDSWDTVWGPVGKWGTAWNAFFAYADGSNRNQKNKQGSPTEFVAKRDEDLPDGLIAQKAIEELKKRKDSQQPFFMGVGFYKPHLPFVAPKKYWDLYNEKDLSLSPTPDPPTDVANNAIPNSGEMFNNYGDQPEKGGKNIRIGDEHAMHLRRAYYAAVSYTDALVGEVLQTLKETGLDKNTIVVVWGDHGWHLGDHTVWGKHTLFERSLHSALIIKTPDMEQPGQATDAIVETVDLYPTLLQLCNLNAVNPLSGNNLTTVLQKPNTAMKNVALGFWRNGISIRSDQYRLTKYKVDSQPVLQLYDQKADRYNAENLASSEQHAPIVERLKKQLMEEAPEGYWKSLK